MWPRDSQNGRVAAEERRVSRNAKTSALIYTLGREYWLFVVHWNRLMPLFDTTRPFYMQKLPSIYNA
jgi:hypothetical protein